MSGRRTHKHTTRTVGATAVAVVVAGTVAACGSASGGAPAGAGGSSWKPSQTVHMDVPFAPGGGSDVFGRAIAQGFEKVRPGLNVTVQNRAGGSGAVGYTFLYSKKGDPYYLLPSETTAVALPLATKTPWKWTSFTPIMQVAEDTSLLLVPTDSPYKSLKDVIAAAKHGKHLRIGVTGTLSIDAIQVALMEKDAGIQLRRVVFESGGEMITGLLGGNVDMGMLNPSEGIEQVKAGKVRGIAVFSDHRYKRPPINKVPTAKEQGVDVSVGQYRGLFAAGDLTDAQIKYWVQTARKWTQSPSFKKYIKQNHLRKVIRPHDEFVPYLHTYDSTIKKALKASGGLK
ncbi:MAG: tripartite tricarboxylate transporter substrate binding protein [Streptosporangiaceae bacterium]